MIYIYRNLYYYAKLQEEKEGLGLWHDFKVSNRERHLLLELKLVVEI